MWTLRGGALVLAVSVIACGGGPSGPSQIQPQTSTQTGASPRTPSQLPYPPPIQPTGGASNIEGEYQLTVTASPSCSLPAEVRQRTYAARVTEAKPGYVTVALSGADFSFIPEKLGGEAGFDGVRNGDALRLVANNGYGGGYYFMELIDGTNFLSYDFVTAARIGDSVIAGTFVGEIAYHPFGRGPSLGYCAATDHQIAFVR